MWFSTYGLKAWKREMSTPYGLLWSMVDFTFTFILLTKLLAAKPNKPIIGLLGLAARTYHRTHSTSSTVTAGMSDRLFGT